VWPGPISTAAQFAGRNPHDHPVSRFELNEDQLEIQHGVHNFAADVMRPRGAPSGTSREGDAVGPIIEGGREDRPSTRSTSIAERVRRPRPGSRSR